MRATWLIHRVLLYLSNLTSHETYQKVTACEFESRFQTTHYRKVCEINQAEAQRRKIDVLQDIFDVGLAWKTISRVQRNYFACGNLGLLAQYFRLFHWRLSFPYRLVSRAASRLARSLFRPCLCIYRPTDGRTERFQYSVHKMRKLLRGRRKLF
jgi:hypothetical protein